MVTVIKMDAKRCGKYVYVRIPLIWLHMSVFFVAVKGNQYDVLCPDSDNPLNIPYIVPMERLVDKKFADVGPIGNDFIDPRDVACESNYDKVTAEDFKRAVNCYLSTANTVECEVEPKCAAQRKETLARLRKATLRILDEVILKISGIKFFNSYPDAKRLLFKSQPLATLSGTDIVKLATSRRFSILNGFSISNNGPVSFSKGLLSIKSSYGAPNVKAFSEFFSKASELYVDLSKTDEPTGMLAKQKCVRVSAFPEVYGGELDSCYYEFLSNLKDRKKLADPDSKLLALLDVSLNFIVNYLSQGMKTFTGVKIPFLGQCIGSKGLDPTSSYFGLLTTIQTVKSMT